VQLFIRTHENDDERNLVLKHREILGVPSAMIAQQIVGRRKVKDKVASYYHADNIIFPAGLNLEQSSSEVTARYKLEILKTLGVSHTHAIDLTGGFGIDSFFLSQYFESLTYVEPNLDLLTIARHNHEILSAKNINYHCNTAEQYIQSLKGDVALVFIDPSRRSSTNQKIFRLGDCEPDVVDLREKIFQRAKFLLVKASPLLDISVGVQELSNVKHVFVVSVNNECKELLFMCADIESTIPQVHAIDIKKENIEAFEFNVMEEQSATVTYSHPLRYLYEPNASILKSGAFKLMGVRFNLSKLHVSTHLYTSNFMMEGFPGRIFEIDALLKSDIKIIHSHFQQQQANVVVRNYPMSPEEIKSKFKLRDGGDQYLIGFSGLDQKYLAKCSRLK
jgi:hypothetical protein